MHQKLHFTGWTRSLADTVSAFLLSSQSHRPYSLRDTVVVVPTAQAGRRLRRALAAQSAAAGTGVLTGQVVTPFHLFSMIMSDRPVADDWAIKAVWLDVLTPSRLRQLTGLFPHAPNAPDFAWRRKAIKLLMNIRAQLAEAGLKPADIMASDLVHAVEKKRWADIVTVESMVLERLDALGWIDPVDFQLANARSSLPPEGVRRVVLAGCPDLAPLVRHVLQRWSDTITIDVVVHAPAADAERFDGWGIPHIQFWCKEVLLGLEESHVTVRVVDQPRDQAAAVGHALSECPEWASAGRFAVGVPDDTVTPFVVRHLEEIGCPCFDPAGTAFRFHPIFRFMKAWSDLASQRSYEALREFVRHHAALTYLEKQLAIDGPSLLTELDTAQNNGVPNGLDDLEFHVSRNQRDYDILPKVLTWIRRELDDEEAQNPRQIVNRLGQIYRDTMLVPGQSEDDAFIDVARHLVDIIAEVTRLEKAAPLLSSNDWMQLVLESAESRFFIPDQRTEAMELEGWLELPWNDAPLAVVTGMNDGYVPAGSMDDLFLPDSVREQLGLRCDASRFARDSYLLMSLQESRRTEGKLVLIAGRRSDDGDVLKPSRLFWRCSDDVLVSRAQVFFTAQQRVISLPERAFSVPLNTAPPDEQAKERLKRRVWNVTDFSAYLRCPFRYYLQRVLEMEGLEDSKEEMDDLDFGKFVHHALEQFGSDSILSLSRETPVVAEYLSDLVRQQLIRTYGPKPPLVVQLQVESAIQRLRAFAKVHVHDLAEGWRIVEVERRCTIRLGDYEVRGKIDRIDRHPDGRYRVLDYKTSDNAKKSPDSIHLISRREVDQRPYVGVEVVPSGKKNATERHWADLQLPLYILFVREAFPDAKNITAGYVQLTKSVADIRFNVWTDLDDRLVESAKACAEGVLNDAARGIYGPPLVDFANDTFDERWWPEFLEKVTPPRPEELV